MKRGRRRDHERRGRERFLLVALRPGCRVILPYYYPLLMPGALLCRGEAARDERKRARSNKIDNGIDEGGAGGKGRPEAAEGRQKNENAHERCIGNRETPFNDWHDRRRYFSLFTVSSCRRPFSLRLSIGELRAQPLICAPISKN